MDLRAHIHTGTLTAMEKVAKSSSSLNSFTELMVNSKRQDSSPDLYASRHCEFFSEQSTPFTSSSADTLGVDSDCLCSFAYLVFCCDVFFFACLFWYFCCGPGLGKKSSKLWRFPWNTHLCALSLNSLAAKGQVHASNRPLCHQGSLGHGPSLSCFSFFFCGTGISRGTSRVPLSSCGKN